VRLDFLSRGAEPAIRLTGFDRVKRTILSLGSWMVIISHSDFDHAYKGMDRRANASALKATPNHDLVPEHTSLDLCHSLLLTSPAFSSTWKILRKHKIFRGLAKTLRRPSNTNNPAPCYPRPYPHPPLTLACVSFIVQAFVGRVQILLEMSPSCEKDLFTALIRATKAKNDEPLSRRRARSVLKPP
jgi:hypothetical protein